jgi:hypothetical protein
MSARSASVLSFWEAELFRAWTVAGETGAGDPKRVRRRACSSCLPGCPALQSLATPKLLALLEKHRSPAFEGPLFGAV